MPPEPPRPRQPSRPDLLPHAIAGDEQPERAAVRHHPGLEGAAQPAPKRTTLTDLPAARPPTPKATLSGLPAPPPLPLEHAVTKPAPRLPFGQTMRAPTPPKVLAAARRSDPPLPAELSPTSARVPVEETSPPSLRKASPLPAPSQRPEQAAVEALRRRAEAAELKAAEADRLRKERDEAREATARATASIAPSSEHGEARAVMSDETIGRFVREVTNAVVKKIGLPAAFLATIAGGGGLYGWISHKPEPPPLTAAQLDERLGKFETTVVQRVDKLTSTTNVVIDLVRCTRKKTNQIGGSLLPAPDHMGSALHPSPYEDDCPDSPTKLPEPKP